MTDKFNEVFESIKRGLEEAIELAEAHFIGKEVTLRVPKGQEDDCPIPNGSTVKVTKEVEKLDDGTEIYRVTHEDHTCDIPESWLKED